MTPKTPSEKPKSDNEADGDSHDEEAVQDQGPTDGPHVLIQKPFTAEMLAREIRAVLGQATKTTKEKALGDQADSD